MAGLNLDAILGELGPRPLIYKGIEFELPGELPAACLAPFLDPELGLVGLIASIIAEDDTDTDEESWIEQIVTALRDRPGLPLDVLGAAKTALDELLGDRAAEFHALKPSVNAYWAIASNLTNLYGVDFFDFFTSDESSPTDGESSKATSSASTDSTLETSGDEPETLDASGSDAS